MREDLRIRTKKFALDSVKLFQALPKTDDAEIIKSKDGGFLIKESSELLRIFSSSRKTAKENQKIKKSSKHDLINSPNH